MEKSEERFNPLFIIGKTRKDGIEYLKKFNIMYNFESCIENSGKTALFVSYKEGTHFYSIYDYNSINKDNDIILNFKGVQGKNLVDLSTFNNINKDINIISGIKIGNNIQVELTEPAGTGIVYN